ncbi:hypothetical protein NPIL_657061 [Nephila pilipes]|uniref:Uncharacterized protein n=1 Tax=Nephila pilipes TaxID=299642 RepID=A0A8X6US49_NEPPI|nr:hypothetical protein NPIL_657061 [Nephila pilipes]
MRSGIILLIQNPRTPSKEWDQMRLNTHIPLGSQLSKDMALQTIMPVVRDSKVRIRLGPTALHTQTRWSSDLKAMREQHRTPSIVFYFNLVFAPLQVIFWC